MIVDLENVTEREINAAMNTAAPGTVIKLHGECVAWNSVFGKGLTGIILDLTDATVRQWPDKRRQFGQPIIRLNTCTDVYVTGGDVVGFNDQLDDGVTARRENYPGISIGGGSVDCGVDGTRISKVWGDFVAVGTGQRLLGKHNERISVANVIGEGTGRHAFSVRDCIGYTLTGTTVSKVNRLWFDHEPGRLEHFVDAQISQNEGPAGGLGIWFQLAPMVSSTCGNITVTDHLLTKGNFKLVAKAGKLQRRSGLHLARLRRAPDNPTLLAKNPFQISPAWTDVTIEP